jgi:DNA/RNA-binding domain of Phe-tRNA-synthetase-like protein
MKLIIAREIFDKWPDLRIGIVVAKGVRNDEKHADLEELKRIIELDIRKKYTSETLVDQEFIRSWRETYRSFGVKPKKYNPTCEALIRRILQGDRMPNINTAVDSYLLAEAEWLLPCGGYDLEKISGDIHLRFSMGREKFYPLGKSEAEETNSGEVVYNDCSRILTRKWNWRDCDFAKITTRTKDLGLFAEAARAEIPSQALVSFCERIATLLGRFCKGQTGSFLVNASEKLEWNIT